MTPEQKRANDRLIKEMNICISNRECINRKDFAIKVKSTPSTITHIQDYTQNIPYPMLFHLYKQFGISINYILFNEGPPRIGSTKKDTIEDLILRAADIVNSWK
jgi:hypothetical protein